MNSQQLNEWLKAKAGTSELAFETIQRLTEEAGWKLKNVVTRWWGFAQDECERRGYVYDEATGQVFESLDDQTTYRGLLQFSESSNAKQTETASGKKLKF